MVSPTLLQNNLTQEGWLEVQEIENKISSFVLSSKIFSIIAAVALCATNPSVLVFCRVAVFFSSSTLVFYAVLGFFISVLAVHLIAIFLLRRHCLRTTIDNLLVKPLGLENTGCNCWVNSLTQFIYHAPTLKRIFQRVWSFGELRALRLSLGQYAQDQTQRIKVSSVQTQKVRLALNNMSHAISRNSGHQEDVTEAFGMLSDYLPKITLKKDNIYSTANQCAPKKSSKIAVLDENTFERHLEEPVQAITLAIPFSIFSNPSVEGMLYNFTNNNDIEENAASEFVGTDNRTHQYPLIGERLRFQQAPDDLFFSFKRFESKVGVDRQIHTRKISTAVNVPMMFNLDARFSDASPTLYDLNAFIVHIGNSLEHGHYISYVRCANIWFECNDSRITLIPENAIARYARNAYIVHYQKK